MKAEDKSSGFPVNIFPPLIKDIIRETNAAFNYPVPYIGASILCAISSAIGNTCCLKVKSGWVEKPVLYVALVGNPGSVKSHPIRFAMNPIIERDIHSRQEYSRRLEDYRRQMREGAYPEKPKCRQRIVQDVTMEGICKVLEDNPAGLCFFCDELIGWLGSMDKYRRNGNDVNKWLSIFNCSPIFVDRRSVDDKITIAEPFVSVIGSIQPKIFVRQFSGQFLENGLLSRMMTIYNDESDDMPYDSYRDIPEELTEQWRKVVGKILDLTEGYYELGEAVYTLTEDAKSSFFAWSDITTDHINAEEQMAMREFFQKIKNYVFRISLILQILYEVCEDKGSTGQVEGRAMILATVFGNYMLDNARKTLDLLSFSSDNISPKHKELLAFLPSSFTKSEANSVASTLGISESTVDKFCKEQQGITIRKTTYGTYEKIK